MSYNTNTDILVAGAFAAFTIDLLVYPLDTIKTRIQSPDYKRLYTNASTHAVNRSLFRGLYQGIGSIIIVTVPSSGAFFTTYEGTKSLLTRVNPTSSSSGNPLIPLPIIHSAASSIAELVSCFILTPAEVLKQNAQMVQKSSSSAPTKTFDTAATLITLKKFKTPTQLWRGYTALAARNLPFTAMQFPLYERLKSSLLTYRQTHHQSRGSLLERGIITALSAGTAGSIAALVTTPIDVVKTRIMLSAAANDHPRAKTADALNQARAQGRDPAAEMDRARRAARGGRAGAWAVGKEIFRSEGLKGLFRGGGLRALWTA
ncbi:MAG: hypothetical protein LQ347_004284, partial [Umbilicaria vellea]